MRLVGRLAVVVGFDLRCNILERGLLSGFFGQIRTDAARGHCRAHSGDVVWCRPMFSFSLISCNIPDYFSPNFTRNYNFRPEIESIMVCDIQ